MVGLYLKFIRLLAKNEYDLKARYIPALIFSSAFFGILYIHFHSLINFGWLDFLKLPTLIVLVLIFSIVPKTIAVIVSGYIQSMYWNKYGNTTIKYIQASKKEMHTDLLNLFDDNDALLQDMLAVTRNDRRLLSKNIFYGFMRNGAFLVTLFLFINIVYFKYVLITNAIICLLSYIFLYMSAQRYAEQIVNSYLETKMDSGN
ncbi:MAG: hypothetical protein PHE67_12470 [Campylobacterales bacterium]|nr:hypothetical protein [Campylobacterales bacterium]